MRALGQQLYAMGIRNSPLLESSSQIVRVLVNLYTSMGDVISMQYGGSEAHKKVKNGSSKENVMCITRAITPIASIVSSFNSR